MNESILFTLGLGFLLGLKHATEADHLAAVSTIVSESRTLWRSAMVGALWGVGHTTSLALVGILLIAFGITLPERFTMILEFCVALMIVLLGSRILYLALRRQKAVHSHWHTHDGRRHFHLHFHSSDPHFPDSSHAGPHTGLSGWRPLVVGMVHGLAGSGALTLLVLTEVMRGGSAIVGFGYLVVFGMGSIGGMLLMSGLIGLPFYFGARFLEQSIRPLRLLTGVASTVFGAFYGWEIFRTF